jgi:hypothetical protein
MLGASLSRGSVVCEPGTLACPPRREGAALLKLTVVVSAVA